MSLTRAWKSLRPHEQQSQLWRTTARFVGVACGRGSGKTELARRRAVRFLPLQRAHGEKPMYFYALPVRDQAKRVAWDQLRALVPDGWVSRNGGISHTDLTIRTEFGSTLHLVGMDKPQRIEGNQWDGGIIDEACDHKPGVFGRTVRPALSHRRGWCWQIGVPKRFGPGALSFKEFYDSCSQLEDHEGFSWRSDTVLSAEEIEAAKVALDPRDYREQFEASWESVSGKIFYAYEWSRNVRDTVAYNPTLPLIIGSDFNVDPMAWVIGQLQDGVLVFFDELFMRNTNTLESLNELHRRYSQHKAGYLFFGDASGRSRKTSASSTDYLIIKNDERFLGSKTLYNKSNPPIVDRFAACNAALCNANNETGILIHPRCKHLIKDIDNRSYKAGSREPDDSHDTGHITDAWGYVIHYLRPIRNLSSDNKGGGIFSAQSAA